MRMHSSRQADRRPKIRSDEFMIGPKNAICWGLYMNTDQTTRRTQNLKLLQGLTKFNGAPKSKHMVLHFRDHNVPIDSSCLSNIYLGKKDIDDSLVPSIEKAFGLPKGWLDGEHEYFTKTSQVDREDIARLLHLDPRTRNAISELLQLLSSARQPEVDQ